MAVSSVDSPTKSRGRFKVAVLTLHADAILPQLPRPITRNRSEATRLKLLSRRGCTHFDDSEDHMEALGIHTSQVTLFNPAQLLSVREKPFRRYFPETKPNSQGRPKPKTAEVPSENLTFPAITPSDSFDSNELDIDLAKFIRDPGKRSVNIKEITVEEVFARRLQAQISPLSHVRKMGKKVSHSPVNVTRSPVTHSLLQSIYKSKTPENSGGKELELRGFRAYQIPEEAKFQRRVRMVRRHNGRLKRIDDMRRVET